MRTLQHEGVEKYSQKEISGNIAVIIQIYLSVPALLSH